MFRLLTKQATTRPFPSATLPNAIVRTTTILAVRKAGKVVMVGDGQVTQGSKYVMKGTAKKVRRIGKQDNPVIAGIAGSTADALTFIELLEDKLEKHPGQLLRSCVDLARDWRRDKVLRHLDATMIVVDGKEQLMLTGNGDVIESEKSNEDSKDGVLAIGSGGVIAQSAALALIDVDGLEAKQIALKSMGLAAKTDVFTNDKFVIEEIDADNESE